MDYNSDEDDDFVLKEPTYQAPNNFKPSMPEVPTNWRHIAGVVLMTTAAFLFFTALGEIASRGIAKWLD